ncbi:MAG TPA: SRPBCC family protein [Candidatus Polarisedimenticolia bacterium]|nr:SRPBCC family protein [Candidatus Polarisedimenticolia bacterium]
MTILIAVAIATLVLLLALMLTRRTLSLHRSVLLHAPVSHVWRCLEDFPRLLMQHGRGRTCGAFIQHAFVKGDPGSGGSVWRTRGSWAGCDYWVDAELVRVEAGREIVIRLLRDSMHTQHGLRGHIARLILQPNGPGTSKLTWDLQARFRPMHLLWQRHCDRGGLSTRLLDISLRSVKAAIDGGNGDGATAWEAEANAGQVGPHARRAADHAAPPGRPEGPFLHPG